MKGDSGKLQVEKFEARQTPVELQFKKIVSKKCRPVSSQVDVYAAEDQYKMEMRL